MQAAILHTTLHSVLASMLQEACDECRQLTMKKLVMVVMCQFRVSCSFVHFDIVSAQ